MFDQAFSVKNQTFLIADWFEPIDQNAFKNLKRGKYYKLIGYKVVGTYCHQIPLGLALLRQSHSKHPVSFQFWMMMHGHDVHPGNLAIFTS